MREQIAKLIETKPKHFSKLIKSDPNLDKWVNDNALIISNNYSEMFYSALHQVSNICANGKQKKFESINIGYIGCGPARTCDCVRNFEPLKIRVQ